MLNSALSRRSARGRHFQRFGGGLVGTALFGVTPDSFSGTDPFGVWVAKFAISEIACLLGAGRHGVAAAGRRVASLTAAAKGL